ncbi:unnamed protein product, partial [Mesorhabditis spiculigera]
MEAMDEDTPAFFWDAARFVAINKELYTSKSEARAAEVLAHVANVDIETVDPEAIIDAKDLILLAMRTIGAEGLLARHQMELLSALSKLPAAFVDVMAAFFVNAHAARQMLPLGALAVAIAFARRVQEEECAEKIAELLGPIAQVPELHHEMMRQLANTRNAERRFRVYEVQLAACRASNVYPAMAEYMQHIIKELEGDDVLTQLTTMDFLTSIAMTGPLGGRLLKESDASTVVYKLLLASKESPDGGFVYPGCVQYFGQLGRISPDELGEYPVFLDTVVDMVAHFDRLDPSLRAAAFDTLANIGYSDKGKAVLEKHTGAPQCQRLIEHFAVAVSNGPVDLRVRHLEAWTLLFVQHPPKADEAVAKRWFEWLGQPFTRLFFGYLQQPFENMRRAAFTALHALMGFEFGKETMFEMNGFIDWLCNPGTETVWEICQEKDDLVRALIQSPSPAVTPELRQKLTEKADPQVAMANI